MLAIELTKSHLRTTDNYIKALQKGGISSVGDLLLLFPREYEDRTEVLDSFSYINVQEKNTILVTLLTITNQKTANNKLLTKGVFEDKNGFMAEGVWFNRKYLASQLQSFVGKKIILSGKVKYAFGKVTFQSPDTQTDLSKIEGSIIPLYSDVNYIPSKWTSGKIELLKPFISEIPDTLPEHLIKKYNFISKKEAIYKIHFPKNNHEIDQAKFRLGYEELFDINYKALSSKYRTFRETEGLAPAIAMNAETVKSIIKEIGFELTDHQKIVLFQVLKDMEKPHAMQRLLEGDVGTGKTIVALIIALHAMKEYKPDMAEILAEGGELQSEITTASPYPSPLLGEEEELINNEKEKYRYSLRRCEVPSPGYVFDLAKGFRAEPTESEEKLWLLLRNKKFEDLKFRRQHPIGRYIADFYCEELGFVIELDGKIHDTEQQIAYNEERTILLESYGFDIFRIPNESILLNTTDKIYSIINNYFSNSSLLQRRGAGAEGNIEISGGEDERIARSGETLENQNNKQNKHIFQVAIMAPTEILARQHFEDMQELFMQFGVSSHLLVGSVPAKQKKAVKADMKAGNIDVIIGTHALVQDDIRFHNLGFVVIDEQHRFGVQQREMLEKFVSTGVVKSGVMPHVLNMTATPIPRTLALTLYGDQDLSIISQYPKGRKEIFTKVARDGKPRQQVEVFVRSEVEKGRQVFWISPLVEESEKMDLANAVNTAENLTEIFHPHRVGLLHGKMKAAEKDAVMRDFSDGKIDILSSTSVVEVGVNIPNASIMCIEGAERFGLSQLHQFRGRVGRGAYQSYCYLFPTSGNSTDRLKAMERSNNGFELAEIDLEIRGPGEVYGLRQSGVPDLKIASLKDLELISQIRGDIEEMFEEK